MEGERMIDLHHRGHNSRVWGGGEAGSYRVVWGKSSRDLKGWSFW